MANFLYTVRVTERDDFGDNAPLMHNTYTVHAQSEAEARQRTMEAASARRAKVVSVLNVTRHHRVN